MSNLFSDEQKCRKTKGSRKHVSNECFMRIHLRKNRELIEMSKTHNEQNGLSKFDTHISY